MRGWRGHAVAALLLLLAAAAQLFLFVRRVEPFEGSWFLYGRDTLFHDAIVQLWAQQQFAAEPTTVPLWMDGVQGGLPTVGAFLWTPLAPAVLPFHLFNFPVAQRFAWLIALWTAGLCSYTGGRALRLRWSSALFAGLVWMLCGHVVTLIHAGHFQKVIALGWLPLVVAGAAWSARPGNRRVQALGIAAGGASIGMMLLGGHPQIAYLGMLTAGLWTAARLVRGRWRKLAAGALLRLGAMVAGGLLLGGAQLLPGLEMGGLSNRAAGVEFAEAVETSYPPGEIAEFIVPRVKGSSVMGDEYRGEWGERIVSDYIGRGAFLLAAIGLAAGLMRRARRRDAAFWLATGLFWLAVGLGKYTPLYRVLYEVLPGFKSFRSPGTFMAGTSLALAMLAGLGLEVLREGLRARMPRLVAPMLAVILLAHTAEVSFANRHFLFAWSWDSYNRDFLAPRSLDVWLMEDNRALETHDVATELNLRPILFRGRALNGYHPIAYAVKVARDQQLGFNTKAWFAAWGVRAVLLKPDQEPAEELKLIETFPDAARQAVALPGAPGMVRAEGIEGLEYKWLERSANWRRLGLTLPTAGRVEVAEIAGPGTEILLDGTLLRTVAEPELSTTVDLDDGMHTLAWRYRPFAWALGVYATALGAAALAFWLAAAQRKLPRSQAGSGAGG